MEKADKDKRVFPRIETECPILYSVGSSHKWQVAILGNMSATGLLMKTKEQLLDDITVSIMTKPGTNRLVPQISAKGVVTRCVKKGDEQYEVSCKLTEVKSAK